MRARLEYGQVRRLLPVLAAVSAALTLSATAWGHASLVRTVPAAGAVLARPPAAVRVVFDDAIRVGPANAAIRNGGGSILAGKPRVTGGRTLVVPLRRALADGDYSVRWSIVSDDGHLESGVLAFAVGVGRAPPSTALAPAATGPTAESVLDRWLLLAGILVCVGLSLYVGVVRPAAEPRVEERLPLLLSGAAVITALGAGEEIHRVGLETRAGVALGAGLVTAVVVATFAGAATLDRRTLRPALVLALGLAAVPASAGHALDPGLTRLNVVADVLHVAGAAAWVGALLGVLVLPGGSVRRTGLLAAAGVLLLGVTGIVRASFELVHPAQLWDTSYGRTLLVKTGILVVALAAGWSLRAQARRRAGVELVLVAGLVVAVSVLVLLRPGRNAVTVAGSAAAVSAVGSEPAPPPPAPPAGAVVVAREVGPLGVALAVGSGTATATVLSPTGGGLSGLTVRVGGRPAAPCGHGCYRAAFVMGTSPLRKC